MLEEEDLCVGHVYSCRTFCGFCVVLKYMGDLKFEFVNENPHPKIYGNNLFLYCDIRLVLDRVET